MYPDHASIICGLTIAGNSRWFPVIVLCGLRTRRGQVVELPARWIVSPGRSIWRIVASKEFQQGRGSAYTQRWGGEVRFAVFRDPSLEDRLADTGWNRWSPTQKSAT